MKVYTKKGDTGTTQLIGGTRVPKSSLRIEAYGTVDELNSYVGLIRDQEILPKLRDQLLSIQDRLFTLGSLLATSPDGSRMKIPELHEEDITNLENWIDEMDAELEPMRNFVLPGGHMTVSFCHITRCVCRRGERIVVDLSLTDKIHPIAITYLNRLSDYFFVLSRKITKDLNVNETIWTPKM